MVVIIGNYINERIRVERRLPAPNPAGSNRMMRLGMALRSVGEDVLILSPGSAMRMGWSGRLFHPSQIHWENRIPILYCHTVGLPILGMLWEQISLFLHLWGLRHNKHLTGLIVYCYYPSSVIAAIFTRVFFNLNVVEDLEDICEPHLSDWKHNSGARPVQQIVGWLTMKIMISISKAVIIPTKKFQYFIRKDKPLEIITGCMEITDRIVQVKKRKDKINVLFAGALEVEHGIKLLVETFHELKKYPSTAGRYRFELCGYGSQEEWLRNEIEKIDNVEINLHGFVSNKEYMELLENSDVCLVLQNPSGRFARYNTPSKGYEFMGNGKAVIVSDIGDFAELPGTVRLLLEPYSGRHLAILLRDLDITTIQHIGNAAYDYAQNHWSLKKVGEKIQTLFYNLSKINK
jgi:glycosyltransferase involved in cell wall biosynthesis